METVTPLPTGWRIEPEWNVGLAFVDGFWMYGAWRWSTWTEKRWFRRPIEREGWVRAGYSSRNRANTVRWIHDTARAMTGEEETT